MKNPLIFKKDNSKTFSEPEGKSKGIADDYAVRKVEQTQISYAGKVEAQDNKVTLGSFTEGSYTTSHIGLKVDPQYKNPRFEFQEGTDSTSGKTGNFQIDVWNGKARFFTAGTYCATLDLTTYDWTFNNVVDLPTTKISQVTVVGGINTAGTFGIPFIVGKVALETQYDDISATILNGTLNYGIYRINYYFSTYSDDAAAGIVTLKFDWLDVNEDSTTRNKVDTLNLATNDVKYGTFIIQNNPAEEDGAHYAVTVDGTGYSHASYNLYIYVERLD